MKPPRLHIVESEPAPDTPTNRSRARIKATPKPPELLQCPRCGARELIETKIGVSVRKGSKPSGGTKQILCAACMMRGERVVVW